MKSAVNSPQNHSSLQNLRCHAQEFCKLQKNVRFPKQLHDRCGLITVTCSYEQTETMNAPSATPQLRRNEHQIKCFTNSAKCVRLRLPVRTAGNFYVPMFGVPTPRHRAPFHKSTSNLNQTHGFLTNDTHVASHHNTHELNV